MQFHQTSATPNCCHLWYTNLLTYTLQIALIATSNNMAQEEHIELIYNSMVCCSIWN